MRTGWFDEIADFLGPAYLRNAFTKGTEQEVEFLVGAMQLAPGMRVLDVGCGPGRHSLALARRGFEVVGVDQSEAFLRLADEAAAAEGLLCRFEQLDVRSLSHVGAFDAVLCLCQGGFGLLGGRDEPEVFGRLARALAPGGWMALTAFSASFAVRFLEEGESFDPATGVLHEISVVRGPDGDEREFDLWTTCFTARELELLALGAGLDVRSVTGVAPGRYGDDAPTVEHPELLLLASRSAARPAPLSESRRDVVA
jgi:SAM-dependent methyltransferase